MSEDIATQFMVELMLKSKPAIKKQQKEIVRPKEAVVPGKVIIDGVLTDKSRFLISDMTDGNRIILLRYTDNTVCNFFSAGATADILNVSIDVVDSKAKYKRPLLVCEDGLYIDINALKNIFKQADPDFEYCHKLYRQAAALKETALRDTNTGCDIVYMTTEQFEKARKGLNMRDKYFKPVKTTGKWSVIAYDNIDVNGKSVLVCLGKKNWNNLDEEITPLFWATSVGFMTDYGNIGKVINKVCDKDECCKLSIPEIKKFNIKMVTIGGLQKVFSAIMTDEENDKLISDFKSAVDSFIKQRQKDLEFRFEKYGAQKIAKEKIQEVKVTMEEEKTEVQEEPVKTETVENTLKESTVTFRDRQLRIAVGINKDKGAIIYYDIKQLCDILEVDPDKLGSYTPQKDNDGNETLISIYDLNDAFVNVVPDSGDIINTLFEISKPAVVAIAGSMGFKVKDSTKKQEDLMVKLLGSNDGRNYTLGAIILAEKFREIVEHLRSKQKNIGGIPGPSNYRLLEDLWKYIDCQEPDRDVPFGFKKQVVAVNERYQRLKATIED